MATWKTPRGTYQDGYIQSDSSCMEVAAPAIISIGLIATLLLRLMRRHK
jgi:hypothetical protein